MIRRLTRVNFEIKRRQRNASCNGEENSWEADEGDIFTLCRERSTLTHTTSVYTATVMQCVCAPTCFNWLDMEQTTVRLTSNCRDALCPSKAEEIGRDDIIKDQRCKMKSIKALILIAEIIK